MEVGSIRSSSCQPRRGGDEGRRATAAQATFPEEGIARLVIVDALSVLTSARRAPPRKTHAAQKWPPSVRRNALSTPSRTERRVQFDFEVEFANGGGLQGQEFRLDIDGDDITDEELADYIIRDLRLLMVGEVRVLNKRIIVERHKRAGARAAPASADGRRRIDLSHTVVDGMVTYRGLPAPVICDFLSREESQSHYAPGTEFQIGMIEMCANTGTYLDSPFHRYADGIDISELSLERLAEIEAVTIDVTGQAERAVRREQLLAFDLHRKAVLIHTSWDRHWGTDRYFEGYPFLTADAATYLVDANASLVGIDSLNIDDTSTGERPVHSTLLASGIPICEHLTNLAALPTTQIRFSAVPVKVVGIGTFPVRAYASLETRS
jgi:arylformamidase